MKEEQANSLIGTWQLIKFANFDLTTNEWVYPYGENPIGYATYSKSGIVTINISTITPLPIPVESAESYSLTLSQFTDYYVGYFGKYIVDMKNSLVTHLISGSTIPSLIGSADPRPFILKGDTLILGDSTTWERIFLRVD